MTGMIGEHDPKLKLLALKNITDTSQRAESVSAKITLNWAREMLDRNLRETMTTLVILALKAGADGLEILEAIHTGAATKVEMRDAD